MKSSVPATSRPRPRGNVSSLLTLEMRRQILKLKRELDDHEIDPSVRLISERIIVAPGATIRDYVSQLTMSQRPMKSVGDRL
jgi:hypothetical protein